MAVLDVDGMRFESSSQSEEQMRAALGVEPPADAPAEASSEPADTLDESPATETPTPATDTPKKPRKSAQARIDEVTREKYLERSQREAAEARAAQLQAELERLKQQATPKVETPTPKVADGRPTVDQFSTYDDYVEALTDWKLEQRQRAAQEHDTQRARFEAAQQKAATFATKVKAVADVDPTLLGGDSPRIHPYLLSLKPLSRLEAHEPATAINAIAEHFVNADDPVALMLHFSDHPEDFQRFSTLAPLDLGREMGKLEARLAAAHSGPASPSVSKAKAPIKPVGSSPIASDPDAIPDDLPLAEYVRRANARERRSKVGA